MAAWRAWLRRFLWAMAQRWDVDPEVLVQEVESELARRGGLLAWRWLKGVIGRALEEAARQEQLEVDRGGDVGLRAVELWDQDGEEVIADPRPVPDEWDEPMVALGRVLHVRDLQIVSLRANGASLRAIARTVGVSKTRVFQRLAELRQRHGDRLRRALAG